MNISFQAPWLLLLLLLVPLLAAMPRRWQSHARPVGMRYGDIRPAAVRGTSWRLALRPVLPAMRFLAVALVIVSAARPQSSEAREIIRGKGVDIALALDISGSMASLDFQPQNRLEAAKVVIKDFIGERQYDRIGLVVFAEEAFVQSPPSVDHDAQLRLVDDIQLATDLRIRDGTAIGLGMATAANMLSQSDAASKIVILLTDGVNNAGQIDPITAATAAQVLGIKVYTIGMGKPGQVPVPQFGPFGDTVVMRESQIDEETLQAIADLTDAQFYRAVDTEQLRSIYDEINQLERSDIEVTQFVRYQELVGWVLLPALLLLLAELVLRHTVFRRIP